MVFKSVWMAGNPSPNPGTFCAIGSQLFIRSEQSTGLRCEGLPFTVDDRTNSEDK